MTLKVIQALEHPFSQPSIVNSLTEREVDVLKLVAQGLTNQDIAEQLFIEERTLGNYISNILGKLHFANRTQAALCHFIVQNELKLEIVRDCFIIKRCMRRF